MLQLGPRHYLAESLSDLPRPRPGLVFLDVETRIRFDEPEKLNEGGLYPYLGDKACLWSIAFDDDGPAIAVPIRMRNSPNLPVDAVNRWLADILLAADGWVNHNVKFDAHFAHVDGVEVPDRLELIDTVVLAKLIDSDRMGHRLKDLLRDWLSYDTGSQDRVKAFLAGFKLPRNRKAQDYALVPSDILGYYGCDDVLGNRELYRYMLKHLPDQVVPTFEMEKRLTPVLFDMERLGLRTDEQELKKERLRSLHKQIAMATKVNELTGTEFADSSAYTYALLIGKWGLPVLVRDPDSGNPTFKYEALLQYLSHPEVVVDPMKVEVINLLLSLREEETFCSLFVDVFLEHRDPRGYVHPSYNQIVRTGRMSCEKPNAQQFNPRAKRLILTDGPGCVFLDADASQIEFRVIVSYIKDEAAIAAYNEDPRTDFHSWVAKLCGIKRKPAKNINFAKAFGAGRAKIVSMLSADEDIVAAVTAQVEQDIASGLCPEEERLNAFKAICKAKGEQVYETYEARLPSLKTTAQKAQVVARARGFVFNVFGRRRHLPQRAAHVAFNTLCQGTAMDIIKRRMIDTAPRYNPELRRDGITLRANIHDDVLFHGELEAIQKWQPWILAKLETSEPAIRVPIRWDSHVIPDRWTTK